MSTPKKIFTVVAIILFLVVGGTSVTFGKTLVYKEVSSDKNITTEVIINELKNGYEIKKVASDKYEETTYTDQSFSTLKIDMYHPEHGTVLAERRGDKVFITINPKGKDGISKKEVKISSDLPWYQDWGLQLKSFIMSDNISTEFWSMEPGKWRAGKFEIRKENIEVIEINGQKIEAIHAKASLSGWRKMLWSGDMWFRKSDCIFLLSKMNPMNSKNHKQFVEER